MHSGLFSVPTLEEQIESLQPGDHVCAITSGAATAHSVVAPFLRRCLARKEMCFYAVGERSVEDVIAELTQAGIDVEQLREEGSLTLLRSHEFMPLETFDPSAFIALFRARAQQALNAGFYGVGFCVEMIWGKELSVSHDALIQVETRLNTEFFPNAAFASTSDIGFLRNTFERRFAHIPWPSSRTSSFRIPTTNRRSCLHSHPKRPEPSG
jgi:hypothetical protein